MKGKKKDLMSSQRNRGKINKNQNFKYPNRLNVNQMAHNPKVDEEVSIRERLFEYDFYI